MKLLMTCTVALALCVLFGSRAAAREPRYVSENCGAACERMASIGCHEAKAIIDCATRMTFEVEGKVLNGHGKPVSCTECWDSARSPADVRPICGVPCTL